MARSRRFTVPDPRRSGLHAHSAASEVELESDEALGSDDDNEAEEDFELPTPRLPAAAKPPLLQDKMISSLQEVHGSRMPPSIMRQGSMATVRIQRRVRLAEKLRDVFELDGIEEVWAGMRVFHLCNNLS